MLPATVISVAASPAQAATSAPSPEIEADDPAGDAAEQQRATFGLQPADTLLGSEQPGFLFAISPGSSVFDAVAVVNFSDEPLTLSLYPQDATTSSDGQFIVGAKSDAVTDVGSWITVGDPTSEVTVGPQTTEVGAGRVVLPISIAVPADAEPGDHAGAVVVSLFTVGESPEGQNVELEQRVAARVYMRVDGELNPALEFTEITATYRRPARPWQAGDVDITYTLTNSGNVRMAVANDIEVSGLFGLNTKRVQAEPIVEILPRSSVTRSQTISGVWPLLRIETTLRAEPMRAVGGEEPGLGPIEANVDRWAVSWEILSALVLVITILVLIIVTRRRRRPSPGAGDAELPEPSPGPLEPEPERQAVATTNAP